MTIGYEFIMELHAKIGKPYVIGDVPQGYRRVIPIVGGTFKGPELKGDVLPGGADWNLKRPDGTGELYARYTIQEKDGTMISVLNQGAISLTSDIIERQRSGEIIDPSEYYVRTTPSFEVSTDSRLNWLNHSTFIGTKSKHPQGGVLLHFYRIV
ncbi:DUF3237 domain-containing protein [Metabacillus endolithicus]|uniref:UPF0311 protein ACFSKK_17790 n=1 Tax=Metabacillus endolithicus TaxID=1535204 RepID=A0ABW5C3A5_9BACI|nr:DUF3237 domain-containing protein [Metabacillus endolithicus]UPG62517.1 DUF3237 domain-containing protein [Metabacillus endolithicus]